MPVKGLKMTSMELLAKEYRKNGYLFKQVWRFGQVAIYAQHSPETGKVMAYEVFEVIIRKEAVLAGRVVPEHESCPSNEQWGQKGYTCWLFSDAKLKAADFLEQIERRNLKEGISNKTI